MNAQMTLFAMSQLKIQNRNMFLKMLLLLSGNVELNPGPTQNEGVNLPKTNDYEIFKRRGMHFLHLNINSILPKIDELRLIAKNVNPSVLGLTETKLHSSVFDEEIKIDGYSLERSDRNRKGGGVACFIKDDLSYNIREKFSDEIESIVLDIMLPKTKPILIGVVYRPPDKMDFLEHFSEAIVNSENFDNQEVYILGDFNINVRNNCHLAKSYKEICSLHGLKQIIDSFTRICEKTSTLIDHILTNSTENILQSGVLEIALSDHYAIYCTRKVQRQKFHKHNYVNIRSLKNYSKNLLVEELSAIQFPDYSLYDSVDKAYDDFIGKITMVFDKIAPFKKVFLKNNTSEWIDDEVFEGIKVRDKLFKTFKRSRLHNDHLKYRRARNQLQMLIRKKKQNFISNKITENIAKPKELWKTLSRLGLQSKQKTPPKICLKENGKVTFEPQKNCEILKSFFANLAKNLVNSLPAQTNEFGIDSVDRYYANLKVKKQTFHLQPTSYEVVLKLLEEVNPSKAVGIDKISGRFLKDGAAVLTDPIKNLCNLSIRLSQFPEKCKIAILKPLFKKGSKLEAKNYRPISLLPLISKIFEKIIHNQTQEYLDRNEILFKFQSGFRKNYSTDTALSYLSDKILSAFDKGLFTGMILIDLQKAFDTIDHDIFLKKLQCLGFSETAIAWYRSYLTNRYLTVNVEDSFSEQAHLACGVPQGSILGPLIFLMYVNDMSQAVKCDLYLYADDSCLVYTGNDVKIIEDNLNKNFNSLCDWFVENKLSIHFGEDKTKSIIFGTKRKLKNDPQLEISRGEVNIKQHKEVKYLGCLFDSNLSGASMAISVLNKANSRLRFLYRKQNLLNAPLRRLLCNALIQPHFDYACTAWYPNLSKALSNKLQCAQNKCIRFCLYLDNRAHLDNNEFKEINWLPIKERVNQRICVGAFNFFNKTTPSYMADIFALSTTKRCTRNSPNSFNVPFRKTNKGQNALSYSGPKLWNDLILDIKLAKSRNLFKHKMKSVYFDSL